MSHWLCTLLGMVRNNNKKKTQNISEGNYKKIWEHNTPSIQCLLHMAYLINFFFMSHPIFFSPMSAMIEQESCIIIILLILFMNSLTLCQDMYWSQVRWVQCYIYSISRVLDLLGYFLFHKAIWFGCIFLPLLKKICANNSIVGEKLAILHGIHLNT